MPTFFADECVARLIVDGLRTRGFDIVDAKDVCQGDDDDRALALAAAPAQKTARLLRESFDRPCSTPCAHEATRLRSGR